MKKLNVLLHVVFLQKVFRADLTDEGPLLEMDRLLVIAKRALESKSSIAAFEVALKSDSRVIGEMCKQMAGDVDTC